MRFPPGRKLILSFSLATAAALVWTWALLYSQNNLFYNDHWEAYTTSEFSVRITGSEVLLARHVIAGFELHPAAMGLRRSLVSLRSFDGQRLDAVADFDENSHLVLGVARRDGIRGIRFSAHALLPSLATHVDHFDAPLEIKELPLRLLPGTHHLALEKDQGLKIWVDGKLVQTLPDSLPEGRIFLSNFNTTVASVSVRDSQGSHHLPFQRSHHFFAFLWPQVLVFLGLGFLLGPRPLAALLLAGALWSGLDYFSYSKRKFVFNFSTKEFETPGVRGSWDFERYRYRFFRDWFQLLGGEVISTEAMVKRYGLLKTYGRTRLCRDSGCQQVTIDSVNPDPHALRIFITGGSLTLGWGTTDVLHQYPHWIQEALGTPKKRTEVLVLGAANQFAVPVSAGELDRYIKLFRPHLVLVETQTQTIDLDVLDFFLNDHQKKKFALVFFRAPQDFPSSRPHQLPEVLDSLSRKLHLTGIPPRHLFPGDERVLPRLREQNLPFIEANAYFLAPELYRTHNLFLDDYHLTDRGHELLGKVLAGELATHLQEISP